MKTRTFVITTLLLSGIACVAAAATDQLVGTWKAPPSHGMGSQTLTVTPAPGGYVFVTTMGPMTVPFAIVPDGKPHASRSAMGPVSTTCHRGKPGTIDCISTLAGSTTPMTFALSADGRTLTESVVNETEHVHYSASSHIAEHDSAVTQGPTTGSKQTSVSKQTDTLVYRKQ